MKSNRDDAKKASKTWLNYQCHGTVFAGREHASNQAKPEQRKL